MLNMSARPTISTEAPVLVKGWLASVEASSQLTLIGVYCTNYAFGIITDQKKEEIEEDWIKASAEAR